MTVADDDLTLPENFTAKVTRMFGDAGRAWLPTLPDLVARCCELWDLRDCATAPFLSFNYIAFAQLPDGHQVALKVGVPHADMYTETAALRHYAGRGAVPFVDADEALGALLIERLQPGTMLFEAGDDEAQTRAAATCMRALPDDVPPDHVFPHVAAQLDKASRQTRTVHDPRARWMPRDLLDAAERALADLGDAYGDVLLHGDLHQENILMDDTRGWLAIDPKGVVGPAPMEVGRYLRNRLPDDVPAGRVAAALDRRLAIFAQQLRWPRAALAAAGLVDGVLSTCWTLDEEGFETTGWNLRLASIRWLAAQL